MTKLVSILIVSLLFGMVGFSTNRSADDSRDIDRQVRQFMEDRRSSWRDLNVPEVDGKALYDIILEHGYRNALEIGTSTGYSSIWIAWALSKTGGKLITLEIDRGRHQEALENFRDAGLARYIDARLGDAHDIVPALQGPFDFVFCDADKDWYINYLKAVLPKMAEGGCFAAHNVTDGSRGRGRRRGFWGGFGGADFFEFARSIPTLDTRVLDLRGSGGLSVSYKKSDK